MLCRWGVPAVLVCAAPLHPGAAVQEHGSAHWHGGTGRGPCPSASGSRAELRLLLGALEHGSRSHPPVPSKAGNAAPTA